MQGGCLCQSVRYQCDQQPVFQLKCHCRDCQKVTGGPYAPIAFYASHALKIEGEVKYFESIGQSGQRIWRGFCPNCGSQLFGRLERFPDLLSIRAGGLDEPDAFSPGLNIFAGQAAAWGPVDTALRTFQQDVPPK